jgi:hypothetical protein
MTLTLLQEAETKTSSAYPSMALTSQQMALKNEKPIVAFHWAQEAEPSNARPSQSKTYLVPAS